MISPVGIKQKLYCYVDESGQDTKGDVFVVSVVVTGKERDELLSFCEKSEQESRKHKDKWGKANRKRRLDYIGLIFAKNVFKNKLRFSIYKGQVNYDMTTIVGIAKAVHYREPKKYSTIIYVDGLRKSKRKEYGSELRKLGVHTRKVQGVNKDENNALIRLADSMAGFVRDAIGGKDKEAFKMFKNALKSESLVEV